MAEEPGLLGRVVAYLHHEVSSASLEPYRRAGRLVAELAERVDALEAAAVVEFGDRLAFPPNVQAALLCSTNAAFLQLVADRLIDADFDAEPITAGYVEPVIVEQATLFYGQVPRWVSRSYQALDNPAYRLDVAVPAALPAWPERAPTHRYGGALLAGTDEVGRRSEPRLDACLRQLQRRGHRAGGQLASTLAEARAAVDYARGLWAGVEGESATLEAVAQLRSALERYYLAGQIAAVPQLGSDAAGQRRHSTRSHPGRAPVLPGPGDPDFQPWCLTDPRAVGVLRGDRRARRELDELWRADPDPVRTLSLKRDIDSALLRGDISLDAGHSADCPWAPIYLVKRSVRVGRQTIHPLDQFTLDLAIEHGWKKRHFRRRVLTGPFFPREP